MVACRALLGGLGLCLLALVHCGGGSATPDPDPGIRSLTTSDGAVPPGTTVLAEVVPVPGSYAIRWAVGAPGWVLTTDPTRPIVALQAPGTPGAPGAPASAGSVQVTVSYANGHRVYGAITLGTLGPGPAPLPLAVYQTGDDLKGGTTFKALAGNPPDPAAVIDWRPANGGVLTAAQGGTTMSVTGTDPSRGAAIQSVTATRGGQTASLVLPGNPVDVDPARVELAGVEGTFQKLADGSYRLYGQTRITLKGFNQAGEPIEDRYLGFDLTADPPGVVGIRPANSVAPAFSVAVEAYGATCALKAVARSLHQSSTLPLTVQTAEPLLFVADPGANRIRIFGRGQPELTLKSTLPLPDRPGQIAVAMAGTLAVGLGNGTIAVFPDFNHPGQPVTTPADQPIDPTLPLCIDGAGNLYGTSASGDRILRFRPGTGGYTKDRTYDNGGSFHGPGIACALGNGDALLVLDQAEEDARPLSRITRFPSGSVQRDGQWLWSSLALGPRLAYTDLVAGLYNVSLEDGKLHVWGLPDMDPRDAPPYPLALPAGFRSDSLVIDDLGRVYGFAPPATVHSFPGLGGPDSSPALQWDLPVGTGISAIAVIPKG